MSCSELGNVMMLAGSCMTHGNVMLMFDYIVQASLVLACLKSGGGGR